MGIQKETMDKATQPVPHSENYWLQNKPFENWFTEEQSVGSNSLIMVIKGELVVTDAVDE